jgi:hypothetical protein
MAGDDHNRVVVLVPLPDDIESRPDLIEEIQELLRQFGNV